MVLCSNQCQGTFTEGYFFYITWRFLWPYTYYLHYIQHLSKATFVQSNISSTYTPLGKFGVQCFAKGHTTLWTGGPGAQTPNTDLLYHLSYSSILVQYVQREFSKSCSLLPLFHIIILLFYMMWIYVLTNKTFDIIIINIISSNEGFQHWVHQYQVYVINIKSSGGKEFLTFT